MPMNVNLQDGFVQLDTLSPNKQFYYRITEPVEVTMGNWGCNIKFCEISGKVIYYNAEVFAHELHIDTKAEFEFNVVYWSKDGEVALYYEFLAAKTYDFAILFLRENCLYKIDLYDNKAPDFNEMILKVQNSNSSEIEDFFKESFTKTPFIVDSDTPSFFRKKKWYPEID
jgi:hypothetical protein